MTLPVVLPARYRIVTGDIASADALVASALAEATELLEDTLQRKLGQQSITERLLPDNLGRLYPTVTPIISAPQFQVWGNMLVGGPFFTTPGFILYDDRVQVTYVGGYVERTANLAATNRLPVHVERDLCWAARKLLTMPDVAAALSVIPVGATSVRLGDAAVTYGPDGAPDLSELIEDIWSDNTLKLGRVGRRV